MAKSRTLNEIRQSKEYQIAKHNADLQAEVAENTALEEQIKKVKDNRTHPCSDSTAKAIAEHQLKYNNKNPNITTSNPFEHEEVDKTVDQIVEDLQPVIYDTIFELICNEMSMKYVFDSSEYLTEAGLELFEDEWFEFYHENHGKIMYKLLQNLK